MKRIVGAIGVAVLLSACADRFHAEKFEKAYRSGQALHAAMEIGVSRVHFFELTPAFVTEVSILRSEAKGPDEKRVLAAYEEAVAAVSDMATIWERENPSDDGGILVVD